MIIILRQIDKLATSSLFIILGVVLIFSSCNNHDQASESDCNSPIDLPGENENWELFLRGDTTVPSFPDAYASYFTYSLVKGEKMGIQIKGEYPLARYVSMNVYDSNEGTTLNEIYDIEMNPDECSFNPFVEQASDDKPNRYFTIHVLPEGSATGNEGNILYYPNSIDSLSIFLRYYDTKEDEYGGVELPYIFIYNTETLEEIENPDTYLLRDITEEGRFDDILLPLFPFLQLSTSIRFYNFSTDNYFANYNTSYLAAGVTRNSDEVYMIRFKPPIIPETILDYPETQARYWSINQGDEDTKNYIGWKDSEFIIAESDSFVNIVIAEPTDEIIEKASGLNFLPWSIPGDYMAIIYRNILQPEDFSGNFNQVPKLNRESLGNLSDLSTLNAYNYIGDFSPVGLRMSIEEYLINFGGFPVSY